MWIRWLYLLPVLAACTAPQTDGPEVPKALQAPDVIEKVGSYSGRSGNGDLVNALFEDVLKSDTALKHVLLDIDAQYDAHGEATQPWQDFEGKNLAYYEDAAQHAARISDTTTKVKQLARLEQSKQRYGSSVESARQLDSTYQATLPTLNDLQELVKIQRTLALMERYQQEHRPDDAVLKGELERVKALESRLRLMVRE